MQFKWKIVDILELVLFPKGQNDKQLVPRVVIPDDGIFKGFRLLGVNILSLQFLISGLNMRGFSQP